MAESGREFEGLLRLVARLRAEDGCPWDQEQTPATIKRYLLEEVYEVVDAVEQHSADHVAEELGDLIFMAIFLAQLYVEQGQFEIDQVLRRVANKMIGRHPHVFGDREVDSARQVKLNWEEIKRQERPNKPLSAALKDIPRALPALMRSHRILSRLDRTFRRPLPRDFLRSQLQESFSALLDSDIGLERSQSGAKLGKLLLLLAAFALPTETGAEEALTQTLERFCQQVEGLEDSLREKGKDWGDLSEAEERSLWENL
ncbi:MAG: nucleoside triphosphate pyrophosphohydrolase [Deltaproteobacteria bacterium]|nr:MAG: nucleoside triphosphate pyrophosphohydrolase [Deltaproteobacteria bacterium]